LPTSGLKDGSKEKIVTVHDPKLSHFQTKTTSKKCDNLGTFTQNVLFLDYNKAKTEKSLTIWGHGL